MTHTHKRSKHQLKSEATRAALLEAAEAVFARDGYERAQIDQIAKESGRTRGAVYAQYKTKEQLFFSLQEQLMTSEIGNVRELLGVVEAKDSNTRLAKIREFYAEVHDARAALLDIEMKLYALRHPDSLETWRKQYLHAFAHSDAAALYGLSETSVSAITLVNRTMALAALKSGLLLAADFLPDVFSMEETRHLLLTLFDAILPSTLSPAQD